MSDACYIMHASFSKQSYRKYAQTVSNLFIMHLNGAKSEVASLLETRCAVCRHQSHVTTQLIKFSCVLTKGRATLCFFLSYECVFICLLNFTDFLMLATGIC